MTTILNAYIDGILVGWFEESRGQITFSYADNAHLPISVSMPLTTQKHKNRAANAYLWGLLPDNMEVLTSMAHEAGTSANSAFGLLRYHGRDVAGAVQLLPPDERPTDGIKKSILDMPMRLSDHELEAILSDTLARYQGKSSSMLVDKGFKFSVAGAQPKIALTADEYDQFLPPSKEFATTHIIKPNDPRSSYYVNEMDTLEVMCLAAARNVGLAAVNAYLWHAPSGDMTAIVTERYDRALNQNGTVSRLHQEDLCQALSVMPEKKYQHEHGGPGLADVSSELGRRLPSSDTGPFLSNFFKAVVFNVGIVGTDAHAKNYSIMIQDSGFSLAPLYDTISAASHVAKYSVVNFPMKIDGNYDMKAITPLGLVAAGVKMGIPENEAYESVVEILNGIPDAIELAAREMDENSLGQSVLDGLSEHSPIRYLDGM